MGGRDNEISRLFAGPFPALEEKLLSRLPSSFGRAGGREEVLLVPSNELREHLLRRLAAGWEGSAAGSSVMTLYDFAVRLLKHRGVFPRELSPAQASAAMLAAVRETYGTGRGDFAAISGTPGFVLALARTVEDFEEGWVGEETLREAEAGARARGDPKADRWAEWRRLLRAVDRKIAAAGGMSRRRIFQEAVAGFEHPGYPFRVTLYGFYDFTRLQWTLLDALLASGILDEVYFPGIFREDGSLSPAFAYAALAWDRLYAAFEGNAQFLRDPASPSVEAVRERLFGVPPPAAAGPVPFPVLSAPHESGELRIAARKVREWLDACPGGDVLLVSRRFPEGMVPVWERVAAEYGIRTAERSSLPLASVPPVRVLIEMIEAAVEDFPRRKVIDILSSPYRRGREGGPGPAPRPDLWDVWTKELLVVSGSDWETRLVRLRSRGGGEEAGDEARVDPEERRLQLRLLREEVTRLREAARPVREARSYAGLAAAIVSLLVGEFRVGGGDDAEGDRDRRAMAALLSLLGEIALIPEREIPWPGAEAALAWLRGLLADQRVFVGVRGGMRIPGAVIAGDLFSLRGVTADRILFLSVNEEVVPAQIEEDPLLPDADRQEINRIIRRRGMPDALALRRRNAAEERLLFSLPAASARGEVAFGVLRADAEGTARRPSRYLLHLLSQFAGPAVYAEQWGEASGASILSLSRKPFAALSGPGPVSAREAALGGWREGVFPDKADREIAWHRVAGILSEWRERAEGRSLFPDPWTVIPSAAVHSSTALEELAMCPYRYFLRRRLGLAPAEEPEETVVLSPAEMGVLLHEILREIGRDAAEGRGWGDPRRAIAEVFARFAGENPVGLPGLFLLQRREIEAAVEAFLAWESARGELPGAYRVEAVEKRFEVRAEGGLPAFTGRVDRMDRGPSGEVEIIDYKYRDGKYERAPLSLIRNGLSHQIPVYLRFARTLSPSVRASLLFLKGEGRAVTVEGGQWEEIRGMWSASLGAWLSLASEGYFPPFPHHRFRFANETPPRYCRGCPYGDHCRVSPAYEGTKAETDSLVRRVLEDPALRAVAGLRPARED